MPPSRRETPSDFVARTFGPEGYREPTYIEQPETLEPDETHTPEQTPTNTPRWYGRASGRTALAGLLLATTAFVASSEEPPKAETTQTVAEATVPHTVYRIGGEGVWLHTSPGLGTPLKVVMPEGSQFNVDCFVPGQDQVNGNKVWLQGTYNGQPGAVTDYYITTHWNTTQDLVNQGIEECGTSPAPAPAEQAPQQPEQAPPAQTLLGGAAAFYSPADASEDSLRKRDNVDYIVLFDPGSSSDYESACGSNARHSMEMAAWLREDPSNNLVIFAGDITEDKDHGHDGYLHQGIQEGLFRASIRGQDEITDQVVVCNYDLDHEQTYVQLKDYMNKPKITNTTQCPNGVPGWRP